MHCSSQTDLLASAKILSLQNYFSSVFKFSIVQLFLEGHKPVIILLSGQDGINEQAENL